MGKYRFWMMAAASVLALACLVFSSVTIVRSLFERERLGSELPKMRQEKEQLDPSIRELRSKQDSLQGVMSVTQTNYNALLADTRIQEGLRKAALEQRDEAVRETKKLRETAIDLNMELDKSRSLLATNRVELQKILDTIKLRGEDKSLADTELQRVVQAIDLRKKEYDAYTPRIATEATRLQNYLTQVGAATILLEKTAREYTLLKEQKHEMDGKLLDLKENVARENQKLDDVRRIRQGEEEAVSAEKAERDAVLGRVARLKEDERALIPVTARLAQAKKDVDDAKQELQKVSIALAEAENKLRRTRDAIENNNQPTAAK